MGRRESGAPLYFFCVLGSIKVRGVYWDHQKGDDPMKKTRRPGWVAAYALLLAAFTVYLLLDTFAIPRVYARADTAQGGTDAEADTGVGVGVGETPVWTENSYSDGNIRVELTEMRVKDTTVYVARVEVASPEYLKTALARNAYGRNVTAATSEIAGQAGAILAINGDYYGARQSGYVIRDGVLYRETARSGAQDLVIYGDGSFAIVNESDVTARELLEQGAVNVLSFGPALVVDGEVAVSSGQEAGRAMADNPRTAIGAVDETTYLLVVADGRTGESEGLTLLELAELMRDLGAQTAYNLDGGGSSTMVFAGRVVNNPTTGGRRISEREVSDIVYIGY